MKKPQHRPEGFSKMYNFTPPSGPVPMHPMAALAKAAQQAFRPPPPMMGGMPGMPQQQQQQGFGAAQGAGMLSGALAGFKGWGSPLADGQTPASQFGAQVGAMPVDQNGMGAPYAFLGAGQPGAGGLQSFFSGMPQALGGGGGP